MADTFFKRIEKKYYLHKGMKEIVLQSIMPYVQPDLYSVYTLCNLYLDSDSDEMIRRSLEKPIYKEKVRLRSYGVPARDDIVFLELKKKYKGVVYKRRVELCFEDAMDYIEHGKIPAYVNGQIMREIDYCIHFYHAKPRLFLAYDRQAYVGRNDSELRITLDENIRSRRDKLSPADGDEGQILLPPGEAVLEIKASGAMPMWLADILNEKGIFPVSFSKYGEIYKKLVCAGGVMLPHF